MCLLYIKGRFTDCWNTCQIYSIYTKYEIYAGELVFISYDDNHYTTGTSTITFIMGLILLGKV